MAYATIHPSGDFPPRAYTNELTILAKGATRTIRDTGPAQRNAYRFAYFNRAYLDFGTGVFTACADSASHVVLVQLADLCRAAHAAQSCLDQASRAMDDDAKRRKR